MDDHFVKQANEIENTARDLHRRLEVEEHKARCQITYSKTRKGWRIVVTRMSDGANATAFVEEKE